MFIYIFLFVNLSSYQDELPKNLNIHLSRVIIFRLGCSLLFVLEKIIKSFLASYYAFETFTCGFRQ